MTLSDAMVRVTDAFRALVDAVVETVIRPFIDLLVDRLSGGTTRWAKETDALRSNVEGTAARRARADRDQGREA